MGVPVSAFTRFVTTLLCFERYRKYGVRFRSV